MLSKFNILQIVNLGEIIMVINRTRAIILTLTKITTLMTMAHGKKSVMLVAKKVVT